jgi:hypothetical protein
MHVFRMRVDVAADYSGASHSTVWNMFLYVDLAEHRCQLILTSHVVSDRLSNICTFRVLRSASDVNVM